MRMMVLVLLVACSAGGGASGRDGGGDDEEDPIDPGPRDNLVSVEVTVYADLATTPFAVGVPVAFNDPSGWGFIVMTDANGVARGEVVDGGSVTALVRDDANPPQLSTILGVRDGDQLRLGRTRPPSWGGSPSTGTPACTTVDFTATFTNVTTHLVSALFVQRGVHPFGSDNSDETTIEPTVQRTITGPGGVDASLKISLNGPAGEAQVIHEVIDGCQTDYELDLSVMLPWLGSPTTQGRRIDVPHSGGVLEGDISTMMLGFSTDTEAYVHWFVLGPPTDSFVLPRLPDVLAPLNPSLSQTSISVQLDDYEAINGYDEARAIFGTPTGIGALDAPADPGRIRRAYRLQ